VTAAAVLAVYVVYARSGRTREDIAVASVAAVTAYVAFSKVFSPQYLVWLIPLVPLVRGRAPSVLLVAILVMTQWWEPWKYAEYYRKFPPDLTTLVLVRNLLVVALLVVLVRELRSDRDAQELDGARAAVF
jgi:TctA family transporter